MQEDILENVICEMIAIVCMGMCSVSENAPEYKWLGQDKFINKCIILRITFGKLNQLVS